MGKLFAVRFANKLGLSILASISTAAISHVAGTNSVQVSYVSATSTIKSSSGNTTLLQPESQISTHKKTKNNYGTTAPTTTWKTPTTQLIVSTVVPHPIPTTLQNNNLNGKANQNTQPAPIPLTRSNNTSSVLNSPTTTGAAGTGIAAVPLGSLTVSTSGTTATTTAAQTTTTSTSTTLSTPSTSTTLPTTSTSVSNQQFGSIGFQSFPSSAVTTDGTDLNPWFVQFNGYGSVASVADPVLGSSLNLTPAIASTPSSTHSALVTTSNSYGNFNSIFTYRTIKQLRTGSSPNPWEVGWVLFHYSDNTHFYYFLAKPTGWELGKEDPSYPGNQRFMATGSNPEFPIGSTYKVSVSMLGNSINVSVNGVHVVSYTDTENPYLSGSFGLYDEDSSVDYAPIVVTQ